MRTKPTHTGDATHDNRHTVAYRHMRQAAPVESRPVDPREQQAAFARDLVAFARSYKRPLAA
jgi:hypothetical protein